MLTQHQIRKYAKVGRFEKLALIDDMIKALTATKQELRDQLIAEGLAEFRKSYWRDDYVTKGHWVRKFVKI